MGRSRLGSVLRCLILPRQRDQRFVELCAQQVSAIAFQVPQFAAHGQQLALQSPSLRRREFEHSRAIRRVEIRQAIEKQGIAEEFLQKIPRKK